MECNFFADFLCFCFVYFRRASDILSNRVCVFHSFHVSYVCNHSYRTRHICNHRKICIFPACAYEEQIPSTHIFPLLIFRRGTQIIRRLPDNTEILQSIKNTAKIGSPIGRTNDMHVQSRVFAASGRSGRRLHGWVKFHILSYANNEYSMLKFAFVYVLAVFCLAPVASCWRALTLH